MPKQDEKVKKKILVVDDESAFVEMIKMRLEASDYEVVTASNGKEGLSQVKAQKPDVVLLDIMMPEMDGLSVLKEIRSQDKKLPVYMLTAFSDSERFKMASQLNASGFIVKTKDLKEQVKNITSALSMSDRYKGKGDSPHA